MCDKIVAVLVMMPVFLKELRLELFTDIFGKFLSHAGLLKLIVGLIG